LKGAVSGAVRQEYRSAGGTLKIDAYMKELVCTL